MIGSRTTRRAVALGVAAALLPIAVSLPGTAHAAGPLSGVDLSTYAAMKKGGKGGPVFVEGDPDKSPLVTSISGDKPDMPKKATPLTKAQVALISAWVKEGAKNN